MSDLDAIELTERKAALEPAVEVQGVSKRFIARPTVSGLPARSRLLARFPWGEAEATIDGDIVDDDDDDDIIEDADEPESPATTREVWALRNVSFDVPTGTSVGIVGGNGAGKTTLLKILARITAPTEGRIVLRGTAAPLMAVMGALFNGDQTGRANVFLLASFLGIDRAVAERKMERILSFAGVDHLAKIPVKHYSRGLSSRLGYAAALYLEPDILLADERLAVGDGEFQRRCWVELEDARERGLTIVVSSHDTKLIRRFCDHAVWIDHGEVRERGSADEIASGFERHTRLTKETERQRRDRVGQIMPAPVESSSKPAPGKWSFNEHVALHSATVCSEDGAPIARIGAGEPIIVEMIVEAATKGAVIKCRLILSRGERHVRASQPEPLTVEVPGPYAVRTRLALTSGQWIGRVRAVVAVNGVESSIVRRSAFAIRVGEPGDTPLDPSPGMTDLRDLVWEVSRDRGAWLTPARPSLESPSASRTGKHCFNQHAGLHSAAAYDAEGVPIDTVRSGQPVFVKIVIEAATKGAAIECGVILSQRDRHVRATQTTPLRVERPGPFAVTVRLPPGALSDGYWIGRVGAVISVAGVESRIVRRAAFAVAVDDPRHAPEASPGIIDLTDLQWDMERDRAAWLTPLRPVVSATAGDRSDD